MYPTKTPAAFVRTDQELFVFVYCDGVDGNNNASERELRDDDVARKTGRTRKTHAGAKRRSIISVLHSIGKQIDSFTLTGVIEEVKPWMTRGKSCFDDVGKAAARQTQPGILNLLVLQADAPG